MATSKNKEAICKSAAHLVAAMVGNETGVARTGMHIEVRDSLDCLRQELHAAGYLSPYVQDDGRIDV